MQNINTCLDKLDKLSETSEWIKADTPGLANEVLAFVESLLDIQMCPDLKETFRRHNGLFMGIDIFNLQTCIISTLQCREDYTDNKRRRKLRGALVISDDGSGNPILISNTGQLYLFHHDDITYEILESNFITVFRNYLSGFEDE